MGLIENDPAPRKVDARARDERGIGGEHNVVVKPDGDRIIRPFLWSVIHCHPTVGPYVQQFISPLTKNIWLDDDEGRVRSRLPPAAAGPREHIFRFLCAFDEGNGLTRLAQPWLIAQNPASHGEYMLRSVVAQDTEIVSNAERPHIANDSGDACINHAHDAVARVLATHHIHDRLLLEGV